MTEYGKACFFVGHREAGSDLCSALLAQIEQHITLYGVTDFYVGGYGNFDRLAAQAVLAEKQNHPDIRLFLVLPYHPGERTVKVPDGFDGSYYPWTNERVPKRLAIVKTNRRMVDTCNYLITYAFHHLGGTGQIVEYARKREAKGLLTVTNLACSPNAL